MSKRTPATHPALPPSASNRAIECVGQKPREPFHENASARHGCKDLG